MNNIEDIITEKYLDGTINTEKYLMIIEAVNNSDEIKRIKQKIKNKEELTESEKTMYKEYKKKRNKKIAVGIGIAGATAVGGALAVKHMNKTSTKEPDKKTNNPTSQKPKDNTYERSEFNTINKALADKDIPMLREVLGSLCYAKMDLSNGEFDRELRFVQSKINIKEPLKGKLISDGKTEFTLDDYADAVFELKENFCDERISDVRKIGKALAKQRQNKK